MDEVRFSADYGGWKSEKSLKIGESTPLGQVVEALWEIRKEASAKAFELAGVDTKAVKTLASAEAEGLSGAGGLASISQAKIRKRLRESCADEKLLPFAEALFNKELLGLLGVKVSPVKE